MKIAVFQMSAAPDPATNLARIETAMQEAATNGARLLIAPELATTGYGRGPVLTSLAQQGDGEWVTRLAASAGRIGISLIAGFPEADGDARYISALVINSEAPDAPVIYRKTCLYGDYERSIFQSNGPSTVIVDLHGIKVGVLICYDVEFPENVRRLARDGADLVAVPTALPHAESSRFVAQHVLRVRGFENQIFMAYADQADGFEKFRFQGLSSITAPDGAVLASAPESGDALIYALIDPAAYAASREESPYLRDLGTVVP